LALTLYRLCKIMQGFGIRQEGHHPSLLGLRNCQDTLSGPCLAFDLAEFVPLVPGLTLLPENLGLPNLLASTFQVSKEGTNSTCCH
jgi:hypothetical protein